MTGQPFSVGIIMDGNRRYAKGQGLPAFEGHVRGYKKLRELVLWAKELRVTHLTVYAFSTENWKRTQDEVELLMTLFERAIGEMIERSKREGIRMRFIGDRKMLSHQLLAIIEKAESETSGENALILTIALSYGGRDELLRAIRKLPKDMLEKLTEEELSGYLDTKENPDPDIIIRTGGEHRLSNFLLWQSSYSELHFTDTLWPDFSKEEFAAALTWYQSRERRNGA